MRILLGAESAAWLLARRGLPKSEEVKKSHARSSPSLSLNRPKLGPKGKDGDGEAVSSAVSAVGRSLTKSGVMITMTAAKFTMH